MRKRRSFIIEEEPVDFRCIFCCLHNFADVSAKICVGECGNYQHFYFHAVRISSYLAFAAIAVYLLCFEVSEAKKKAIALAGVLYIIYVGLYFSVHQSLAMMGLINIGNLMKNDGAIYAVIAVKVLLVAAAVVFLLLGEKKQNETAELAEEPAAEEAATPAEPVEEEKPVEETQEPEPAE